LIEAARRLPTSTGTLMPDIVCAPFGSFRDRRTAQPNRSPVYSVRSQCGTTPALESWHDRPSCAERAVGYRPGARRCRALSHTPSRRCTSPDSRARRRRGHHRRPRRAGPRPCSPRSTPTTYTTN
jgi:hypothetical protein